MTRRVLLQVTATVLVALALARPAAAQVYMGIDGLAGDVGSPVGFCGFAFDTSQRPRAGITAVTAYFSTPSGLIVVPAQIGLPRPDISAVFSSPTAGWLQDANTGWCVPPTVVPAGTTSVLVRAQGTKLGPNGDRLLAQRDFEFTVGGSLFSWTNWPKQGTTVGSTFDVIGVATDTVLGGSGIRYVTVETVDRAHPDWYPRLWGYAVTGQPRTDAYNGSGITFTVSGIAPGSYDLKVTSYSLRGEVETRLTRITVQ
jgi:hypothetical protein